MLKKLTIISLVFLLHCLVNTAFAQEKNKQPKVIQFSGVVVTSDSLMPVPFVSVGVKNKYYGATTDYYGYFSLAAVCGDTLQFNSVGYRKSEYIIPANLEDERYSIVHVVHSDTTMLNPVVIYPWPSKDELRAAFLALNIPDDEIARAEKNLDPKRLAEQALNMPSTGALTFKYAMQQKQQQLYYNGQAPPITVLNPFAWAQFIKAWRDGKFKRQDKSN